MRIIVINVLYPPHAFGGATIVAAQTTRVLAEAGNEVLVITSDQSGRQLPGSLYRYEWEDVPVVAVSVAPAESAAFRNESFAASFANICDAFRPDVVIAHCVQGMGASFLEHCEAANIATVVFVHDAWWLCERQFMINALGSYCHQSSISHDVCRFCVVDLAVTMNRDRYLRERLARASSILFPSRFFRELHVASGFPAERCCVVKNGVKPPLQARQTVSKRKKGRVRFGFVGGVGPLKGSECVRVVFSELERTNYDLVCVDNMTNLGLHSLQYADWRPTGRLKVRPGYTQNTIDQFFDEIDILLFPTQVKESFGLVVREALIRHKWAIVTDGGGTTEDLIDGVNGRVIPLGQSPGPLREAVLECFERDWSLYRNPYAEAIVTFDQQAVELRQCLERAYKAKRGTISGLSIGASDDFPVKEANA
jgi:glycosyltransferase involved in cell wall biosynthesis